MILISGHSQLPDSGHITEIIGGLGALAALSGLVVVIIINTLHTFHIGNILRHILRLDLWSIRFDLNCQVLDLGIFLCEVFKICFDGRCRAGPQFPTFMT